MGLFGAGSSSSSKDKQGMGLFGAGSSSSSKDKQGMGLFCAGSSSSSSSRCMTLHTKLEVIVEQQQPGGVSS
uniref:Uncharacterized protein n=1 Tax=Tetradesmus obliquus TaxID=3088 RepID=A0A383VG11_TETOB